MELLGARIRLNPQPTAAPSAPLEVAMLGHCPGRVRIDRLRALPRTLAEMREQGLGQRVDLLEQGDDEDLYHLPIPVYSVDEFKDIFPDAFSQKTQYKSLLAGARAWLPAALEDFFVNGGHKLWVVRLPESEGVSAYTRTGDDSLLDVKALRGLSSLLILRNVGLIAMPDLERLQIPAQLLDIPRKRLANPDPQFLPCGSVVENGPRERRYSEELIDNSPRQPVVPILRKLLTLIARHRPDIQCLLTLPLEYSQVQQSPAISQDALDNLELARQQSGAHLLRQIQLLFPYLRNNRGFIHSPVGLLAGAIDSSARRNGTWRSIGGTALKTNSRLFPVLDTRQVVALREAPGVGVLHKRAGRVCLDDERIAVPAFHRLDYTPGSERGRSGEVVRFMGFLLRQLKLLGERLVFDVDYRDPRPRVVLEQFFERLYLAGALRGRLPEEAFRVSRLPAKEGMLAYTIEVAPAFPIDKLTLTFINNDGHWQAGVGTHG
jgi:hypothetical protein